MRESDLNPGVFRSPFRANDGLIFDLDGTLWDTTRTVAKVRNAALRSLGIPGREITAADVARTVGLPVDEIYRRSFADLSAENVARIQARVAQDLVTSLAAEGGLIYPGVTEGLERLRERFRLFIVSNCNPGYIESFLRCSGTASFFDDFECWGATHRGKADNIADIARRNRLRAPIYIGDTQGDRAAAAEAGVTYVHVDYGFGEPSAPCPRYGSFASLSQAFLEESFPEIR